MASDQGGTGPTLRLVAAKTRVPLPPPHFLRRPRLLEALQAGVTRKLVVVIAPSGFGKTTLVAEFARTVGAAAAWLSLDAGDQDLAVFVQYLIGALAQARPGWGGDLRAWLAATPAPAAQIADCVAILLAELEPAEAGPLVLFLDDFHEVSASASIAQLLDGLLRYLPAHVHIVLSARAEPALTTTRLLVEQQIGGLGADALRFTVPEAQTWLALRAPAPAPAAAHELVAATEGWITGMILYTAAAPPRQGGLHAEHVYAYLSREVLERQPAAIQRFLQRAAVLTRLTPAVCDAVLETDDAAGTLRWIHDQQLFLTATGGAEERSYRLHQLFREFLANRLRTTHPAEFARLHRRAARYFEQQDDPGQAMEHLFAAADWARAAALATRSGRSEIDSGRAERVEYWLSRLPAGAPARPPALLLLEAWLLAAQSQFARAAEVLARAEHLVLAAGDRAGYADALGLRARLAAARRDGPAMVSWAEAALAIPEATPATRAHALHAAGLGYAAAGASAASDTAFAAAWAAYAAIGDGQGCAWVSADWGAALVGREEWARAVEQLEQALSHARQWSNRRLLALVLTTRAVVQQRRGDLHGAGEALATARDIVQRLRWRRLEVDIRQIQAENTLELDGPAAALALYAESAELAQHGAPTGRVEARIGQARCLRYLGRYEEAARLAREGLDLAGAGAMAFEGALCRLELGAAGLAAAPAAALPLLQEAEATLAALGGRREGARAAAVRAIALFATADYAEALAALERAYHAAVGSGSGAFLAPELATTAHGLPLLRRASRDDGRYSPWLDAASRYLAADRGPAGARAAEGRRHLQIVRDRPPTLEVYSLGQTTVYLDGAAVARSDWQTATAKELFCYFVEYPAGQRREVILAALWPDQTATRATNNFHTALRRLRAALGAEVITTGDQLYRLSPALVLWHDGAEALRLIDQARRLGPDAAARRWWLAAADLLRGPYAEEFYRDWAGARRQFWDAQTRDVLVWLADDARSRGALSEAVAWARRLLALDPLSEAANGLLMRLYAGQGNLTLLTGHYTEFCRVTEYELGGPPSAETQALYLRLLHAGAARVQHPS